MSTDMVIDSFNVEVISDGRRTPLIDWRAIRAQGSELRI